MEPIASDLSAQVLQMRRRRGELGPQVLDSRNCVLYGLPSVVAQREAFVSDLTLIGTDSDTGDRARPDVDRGQCELPERAFSVWHRHMRKG